MDVASMEDACRMADNLSAELRRRFPTHAGIATCVRNLMCDRRIIEILNQALVETALRNYINKHGVEHGHKTASNMLRLFHLIDSGCVQSDYIADFPEFELQPKHLLWALLVASYVHDVGRFYDPSIDHESQVSEAIKVCEAGLEGLGDAKLKERDLILRVIKELCMCHDKKAQASGKVEIALIKLADAFDCTGDRVYEKDKWRDKDGNTDEIRKVKDIFCHDRLPEHYFGTCAVNAVDLEWNEHENTLDANLAISSWAASLPIKTIYQVLRLCEGSAESLANLCRRIRLIVHLGQQQTPILLYPASWVATPDLKVNFANYHLVLDDAGGGEVRVEMETENISKAKRKAIRFEFWGLKETAWADDVQVEMWAGSDPLQIEYKGKGDLPISHTWLV